MSHGPFGKMIFLLNVILSELIRKPGDTPVMF